mgnify:CR=1 FL=1
MKFFPESTLHQLEFDKIKEMLAAHCRNDYARIKALNLRIHTKKEFIERGLQRLVSHHQVQFDPLVKYICLQLSQHDKTVNEITKDIPMSIRPIQKHFKKITGLTMVEFRNIERLRASSKKIFYNKKGLSDTALEHGFTDHAHFIHSFQKYMLDVSMKTILAQTEIMNFNFAK